jgi:hypothetical protein
MSNQDIAKYRRELDELLEEIDIELDRDGGNFVVREFDADVGEYDSEAEMLRSLPDLVPPSHSAPVTKLVRSLLPPILNARDRDWLQEQALRVREIHKRGMSWHAHKGLVLYLVGACILMWISGAVFANEEIGTGGASLAFVAAVCAGAFYFFRNKQDQDDWNDRRRIEAELERRGMKISHDGKEVSDGNAWYDPLSSDSYR